MVDVPAGTFLMGENGVNGPVHEVSVTAFIMQETEVTQEQYRTAMGNNPATFTQGVDSLLKPVESCSWLNAIQYCNAISKQSGLDSCYSIGLGAEQAVICDYTANGYRLPTEAEWEYACRATTTSSYFWGAQEDSSAVNPYGWYEGNSNSITHVVGTTKPNAYGLYDMSGNVFEWCNDWYGDYNAAPTVNPKGALTGTKRVVRGGSWFSLPSSLQSANRNYYNSALKLNTVGFRVVRTAK